jgi:hypothetical protein
MTRDGGPDIDPRRTPLPHPPQTSGDTPLLIVILALYLLHVMSTLLRPPTCTC